jgi:hypothetical protein
MEVQTGGEELMTRLRFKLIGLVVALALAAITAAPPAAQAFGCRPQSLDDQWIYFSDASHSHAVGRCENDCGQCWCSGIQTAYYIVITSRIC